MFMAATLTARELLSILMEKDKDKKTSRVPGAPVSPTPTVTPNPVVSPTTSPVTTPSSSPSHLPRRLPTGKQHP
jgi:hypothetical protein